MDSTKIDLFCSTEYLPDGEKSVKYLPMFFYVICAKQLFSAVLYAETPKIDFVHEVVPVLKKHCASCHTNGTYKGSLSMDTREALLKGKAAIPGNSKNSEIIKRIHSSNAEDKMPPKGSVLDDKEKQILARWVDAGLPWESSFSFKIQAYVPPIKFRPVSLPAGNGHPIDRLVNQYLQSGKSMPLKKIGDQEFYRRASMDLVGLLPTPEELADFAVNGDSQKREKLVANLLADKRAYADHWMSFFNDILRNEYKGTGYIDGGRKQITQWLYPSLLENKHYDLMVRELINPKPEAEGFIKGIKWRGNVNASQVTELQFSQNISQVFFGVNMKCASCHDSFIDTWKLDDAYALAGIVSDKPLQIFKCDKATGNYAKVRFLWPELGNIDANASKEKRLEQLAGLITSPENGRFARTMVNRYWQRLFGRGIVHPVDIMANKPWSEELLDYLANYFKENQYDLKKLLTHIVTSNTYQAMVDPHAEDISADTYVFHGPLIRRLSAEQFMDAVWMITGTAPAKMDAPLKDLPEATGPSARKLIRAVLVHSNLLMRSLGRPNREQVVTTRAEIFTTLEALDLTAGSIFNDTINRGAKNMLEQWKMKTPDQMVRDLFLRSLSRDPSAEEKAKAMELLGSKPGLDQVADLLWVIFLLPEFQLIG